MSVSDDDREQVLAYARRQAEEADRASRLARDLTANDALERDSAEAARRWAGLADAMLAGGKITASEYLMYATFAIEGLHQKRWLAGDYTEIEAISEQMRAVERRHGLKSGEYWLREDEPADMRDLSRRYEAALDDRFRAALVEFGLTALADLWSGDRQEYDRQREVGRRSIFAKNDHALAVTDALRMYEQDAQRSADAGAFYAAVVMLGSAAEARLLAAVLSRPAAVATSLATKRAGKSRSADPLGWSLDQLIAVAEEAGWIGVIEDAVVGASVTAWLRSLRATRNLLHPGRHARDKPHVAIGREEYEDARMGYAALCIALAAGRADAGEAKADRSG